MRLISSSGVASIYPVAIPMIVPNPAKDKSRTNIKNILRVVTNTDNPK